jgi:hypothetical protein
MGRNRLAGSVDATLPVVEGVEGVTAGSKASQDTAPQFSHRCSSGQECLTCASQMSRGENSGALALAGIGEVCHRQRQIEGHAGHVPRRVKDWCRCEPDTWAPEQPGIHATGKGMR